MAYRVRPATPLFRLLLGIQVQWLRRPLRLSEARHLWRETNRFLRDDCDGYMPSR